VPPSVFYLIYRVREEEDLAYEWFERAVNNNDGWLIPQIVTENKKYYIPDQPRYNVLLKKVGLNKY
jgi:hypothetical protein